MTANAETAIRDLIRAKGRITFAAFMEAALYGPGGYYTAQEPIGEGGDYYTSPSAHPAFGALIALQLEQMWLLMNRPEPFTIVEPGAGDGTLAKDILAFARRLEPGFSQAIRYVAVERRASSPAEPKPPGLQRLRGPGIPITGITGCVLSNELIDSFPVHRVSMRDSRLRELYVTLRDGRLAEVWDEPSTPEIAARLALEQAAIPEAGEGEVNLLAAAWMAEVAERLRRGYVITIDYGDMADRLYSRERARGTVMSYFRHTPQGDPYARIGRQDLTAHANFTTLVQAGAADGLRPLAFMTQRQFLQNLGMDLLRQAVGFMDIAASHRQANVMALRELVRPEGLGKFRVLVQGKGVPARGLACMGEDPGSLDRLRELLRTAPVPVLDLAHVNLLAGKYPGQSGTWITGSWEDILGGKERGAEDTEQESRQHHAHRLQGAGEGVEDQAQDLEGNHP